MATNHDISDVIAETLDVLKRGGLILYPTDTVWGIGCDATNEAAVQRVFALKRRAEAKSLVLLACDLDMVARYIRKIPSIAVDLVSVNDAPMTIVYPGAVVQRVAGEGTAPEGRASSPSPAAFGLAPSVVAADGSVGIRIPWIGFDASASRTPAGSPRDSRSQRAAAEAGDERPVSAGAVFCNRLIYRLRRPLVSTSANISGEPAPASFDEISPEILAGVDYVVPAAVSGLALPVLSRAVAGQRSAAPPPASRAATSATSARQRPAAPAPSSRQALSAAPPPASRAATSATSVRFDDSATGRPSQILKLGLDGEVEIIRP
ncbi:MAG: Sua5/YciO/YrdC/YwlC family protein [Bacteroidales bacterium]|nr:Sua5/YciO/YrdC/YwlC family protein [Bacteroidales bacterium]